MMLTPTDMLIIGMVLASLACLRRKRCGATPATMPGQALDGSDDVDAEEAMRAQDEAMMELETWRHGL